MATTTDTTQLDRTRRKLRELDDLLERMLALPTPANESDAAKAVAEQALTPLPVPSPPPVPAPELAVRFEPAETLGATDRPAPGPEESPPILSTRTELRTPTPAASLTFHQANETGGQEVRFVKAGLSDEKPAPVEPLPAIVVEPARNFWPIHQLRNLAGVLGILMLALAVALWLSSWRGWTW